MSDIALGPVVLGGNVFGWTVDRAQGFQILDEFVARGGVAIDTADVYPNWAPGRSGGESEQLIGEWLSLRGRRERLTIASKVGKWAHQPGLAPANVRAAVEGSLRRLRTDYLDIYYAHEDDPRTDQRTYLSTFDALVKEGKVRALGASNFNRERLQSALKLSRENSLAAFEFSQDHYNLVERGYELGLMPVIREQGLIQLPYWSLASGFLTGKYRPGAHVASERAQGASAYLAQPKNVRLLDVLDALAKGRGVSVTAIALTWLRAQPTVAAPIASARTVSQLAPLFESATVQLSAGEIGQLSALSANH